MLTKKCIRCISRDSSLFYSSGFGLSVSRRITTLSPGCFMLDLVMLMLSLQYPELDGVPVLQHVQSITVDSVKIESLLTHGQAGYTYWPVVSNFPSFKQGAPSSAEQCQENLQKLAPRRVRRRPFEGVDLAQPLLPLRMGDPPLENLQSLKNLHLTL